MPLPNRVIIAAAGSGKTTTLVQHAISRPNSKIALLTYTINNLNEIKRKFYSLHGSIPRNVTVLSWFTFLLRECVRPYQNFVYDKHRIESIVFVNNRSAKYVKKTNVKKYYLSGRDIFSDKVSEFAILCNQKSKGMVINRLSDMFDEIYIDEVQDLAGYDLDLVELLLKSRMNLVLVGDNRQATYATNSSAKNNKYRGFKIDELFTMWEKKGLCQKEYILDSYRCNQLVCNLADDLYPEMPGTISKNTEVTGHDGVFLVAEESLDEYISKYSPTVLRYDRRTDCRGYDAKNFGDSKGLTFDRVLIFPNGPIKKYLATGDPECVKRSRAKFYVAITRAKYSVAFVYSGQCKNRHVSPFPAT